MRCYACANVPPRQFESSATATATVKRRILELLQNWSVDFPNEVKLAEAVASLKQKGMEFPLSVRDGAPPTSAPSDFLESTSAAAASSARKLPPLENPTANERLSKLLQSRDPRDLIQANELIKAMYDEESRIAERIIKLKQDLELVRNNVKVLREILVHFKPADGRVEDNELIQVRCARGRFDGLPTISVR